MTNTISSASGSSNRPRLCRSDHQPNMLEYIDTAFNESFISRLKIHSTSPSISNTCDQFGNTIVDQYLLYILCQKLSPIRNEQIGHSLHQLFLFHGTISKSFFEYSPSTSNRTNYSSLFTNYTNFIWNEFDPNVLLELACFLLKYRLREIFENINLSKTIHRQKITGYFLEIIVIYYLTTHHSQFFIESRAKDMLFPLPANSDEEKLPLKFEKFLRSLHDNGEVIFDIRQVRMLLQSDAYQFINKKLENKKFAFMNFFENILRSQRESSCQSLKSLCRYTIKMHVKQYPHDIKELTIFPSLTDQLLNYLTYENTYAFESFV